MKFLVAIDGSEASQQAIERTLTLAQPGKDKITLMTVMEPLSTYYPRLMMPTGDWVGVQAMPDPDHEKALLERAGSLLHASAQVCQQAGVDCDTKLELGAPRHVICDLAKAEAPDFLVIGSRGLGTMERVMLGSVSDFVVHHCTCPVIVVR
ncbi:UspA domain-containing protein [Thalassoporum mexicanum PCC 7367]|uniref:universal stress protein n=1 Tax=Thalassoporum mexicanum TaxID=3457544 RepID=UPI00029FEAD2|nr:universal stress protein [Pseudanabaena sp. PCC 7367]AFY70045.1 UspA domain-containing protein [Pseudanabaena sp. PCC 7367]